MTMLAVAPPWTTASSINLCCATPVLPVAIGQLSSPPLRPLPKELLNARGQQITSAENPIASDALLRSTSRGFLPWRFSDAGPGVRGTIIMGRHPKTFTVASILSPSVMSDQWASSDMRDRSPHSSGKLSPFFPVSGTPALLATNRCFRRNSAVGRAGQDHCIAATLM
jgi:hypothetical protein